MTNHWPTPCHKITICTCMQYVPIFQYSRGRTGPTWRRQGWVFGMMEIKHNRWHSVLKMVENRSQETLIPIIRQHVRRGSTILGECWRAYVRSLNRQGCNPQTVNHTNNFVDPRSACHTQDIERGCQTIKGKVWRLRGNRTPKR